MSQNLTKTQPHFSPSLIAANGKPNLPMPFTREILLLECCIAGTSYREDIAEIEPQLEIGAQLRLQREPRNEHDESAVAIFDANNYHLGYIPRNKNEILARLLDAGKRLSAKLTAKEWNNGWLKINVEVFLHD